MGFPPKKVIAIVRYPPLEGNVNITRLAYLAGAMDSDGCFTIKRSTHRKRRRGDCLSPSYFPRILFGQVQPEICELLKTTFGGHVVIQRPRTRNSLPMFKYSASCRQAAEASRAMIPHLILKKERAKILVELQEWQTRLETRRASYWWLRENPNWESGELIDAEEVASILGYSHPTCVTQALKNGTLVGIPYDRSFGSKGMKRFPRSLVEFLHSLKGREGGRHVRYVLPPQHLERCESLYQEIKRMNRLGINGTPVNHRTGYHALTD